MGLFSIKKKEDKIYSLGEAIKILQTKRYENFTTIPVGNGYKLVPLEQQIETNFSNNTRKNFLSRMTSGVNKDECNKGASFNDYQNARGYRKSIGISR